MAVRAPERPAVEKDPTDAELVERARNGDAGAYAEIYRRHRLAVTQVVRARTGQGEVADAVQETFTRAWIKLGALRDPERLRPWLLQIARRTAIEHGTRAAHRAADPGGDAILARQPTLLPGPEDRTETNEAAARVEVGLRTLNRRDALAINLAAHLGFGPDEIAEVLGVTPGNAKVILHRARNRLRAALAA